MKKGIFYLSIAIIIYILTFAINLPDSDLWARLAVGSIFFQTGHVLQHDIFSYLPTKDLWIDHEWGSGVVFYFLARYLGEWGIFALKAFILFAILILIIKIIKLQANKDQGFAGVFYFIFLGFSLIPGIASLIRCQMFTYLFFTLWIYALERIRRQENQFIWIFPVTMLLWVNLHGGFLAGIGLIIIYAAGELLNYKNPLKYLGILALIIPATLMNPYGFELWNYMIDASFMPRPYIQEWQSISLNGPIHMIGGMKIHILAGFMIFALLTIMVSVKLLIQKGKPDWTKIILVTLLLYLSVKHQRHSEFFVLAVSGLLYHQYVHLFDPVRKFIKNKLSDKTDKVWEGIKYGFGYILLGAIFVYSMPYLSHSIIVDPMAYPVGSIEFIKQNNLSGNIATTYNWGSYASWKLYPQGKVLIDGRYEEVYPDVVYDAAMQFSEHQGDWRAILRDYHADVLVLSKRSYSPADVSNLTDWKLVYQDMSSVVLLPKDKIKSLYIYPDYKNPTYFKEDFSKKVKLD
ncbi:MAG: hypothetical protein CVU55_03240 [Deltaproteobacteria bacterium HGW-Deltaproteobacteria-13]|nr:MAG: hypothetical protein CVU55_03240 [Deltaproteobacteria bacterium HGW-Deltaproteobacteria-13]